MTPSSPQPDTAGYSHGHQPSVLASHAARTASNSCGYFLDRVRPGMRILDVGCGPGSITLDLAELVGRQGEVVGIDFSADAIEAARRAAGERGDGTTRFIVADLDGLDLAPASFDIVHAHQVLQHLSDPVGALRAMVRFCSADGIVAVRDADYAAMSWFPENTGIELWRETYSRTARATGGEPDAGRRLRGWAQAAGLEVVSCQASVWTYATPETASWWGTSQADRVRHSTFAQRATADGLSPAQIEAIARGWEAWGAHPEATFLMPHVEVIARARRN